MAPITTVKGPFSVEAKKQTLRYKEMVSNKSPINASYIRITYLYNVLVGVVGEPLGFLRPLILVLSGQMSLLISCSRS